MERRKASEGTSAISGLSVEDLLGETRAYEIRALVERLLEWMEEATHDLVTFCEKSSLHPDPSLVKTMEATLRDGRMKHTQLLEAELADAFPVRFSALIAELDPIEATLGNSILHEARLLSDRTQRALWRISHVQKFWSSMELLLQKRATMDAPDPDLANVPPIVHPSSAATYGLLSHVELMLQHMDTLEAVVIKLKYFWGEYLLHLHPIELQTHAVEGRHWDMDNLLLPVHPRIRALRKLLAVCRPLIHKPYVDMLQHK